MFGSHLSIAGGLHNALLSAEKYQMDTVQIFTKNQQQWKCKPLDPLVIEEWKKHAKRLKFKKTVSHDSYLINLAATNDQFWRQSVELFVEEIRRCQLLGIPYLVTHPGAHMGAGEEAGITKIVAALDVIHDMIPAGGVTTCLEITAGQGSCLGCKLEHLAEIIERVRQPKRLAVCLDTAHLFAAGYDFRGRKYAKFSKEIERTVGIKRVKVLHLNDSKKDLGSRVDRHDHIGRGKIGLEGFKPIVRDEAFKDVPKILETPKEKDEQGRDWDEVNIETLRSLEK
jgi:deoxyribonuclease IV